MWFLRHLSYVLLLLPPCVVGHAEGQRTLAVLQTTDSTQANLGPFVQKVLADRFQKAQLFKTQTHPMTLAGYTPEALSTAFNQTQSEILSFAYLDKERIALFLFDLNRPGRYVATSETLTGSPQNRLTEAWVDNQLNKAFSEMMRQFALANFETIPEAKNQAAAAEPKVEETKQEKARSLFQQLSAIQDGSYYVGAHLGMVRFAAKGASASTVDIGAFGGIKLYRRLRFELGADIFSYLLLHADVRVQLPLAERYVSLSLGLGGNLIAAVVTQNRGFNPTYLTSGQMLFGPSLSFEVPLLGAALRGDIKVLLGSASILLATYGLYYAL